MPFETQLFIKTGILCFVASLLLASLRAASFLTTSYLGVLLGAASPWWSDIPAVGAAGWGLEALSAALFAVHLWPRIKGFGR